MTRLRLPLLIIVPLVGGVVVLLTTLPLTHSYNPLSYKTLENPFPGHVATPPEAVIQALDVPDWAWRWRQWDVENVEPGKTLYEANCAACHGKNLDGKGEWATTFRFPAPPADFRQPMGPLEHHSIQHIFWRINEGGVQNLYNSAMPTWGTWGVGRGGRQETVHTGDLTTEEIWEIIRYIYRATEKKPVITPIAPEDHSGMDM